MWLKVWIACSDGHAGGESGTVLGVIDAHGAELGHGKSLDDLAGPDGHAGGEGVAVFRGS